jgi:uncharacterized protein (TIGR04255 family)
MSFNLNKPPVIETWARANMVPAPESTWQWLDALRLLKTYREELPILEDLPEFTPQAKRIDGGVPTEIELLVEPRYFRCRTKDRSRIVQVGRNELVVGHGIDKGGQYPGFSELLREFLAAISRYLEHLDASSVDSVELHYVDLIVIPELYVDGKPPSEYFEGAPELPVTTFGEIINVAWSYVLSCPGGPDVAQLAVELLSPDPETQDGRFRINWHATCPELGDGKNAVEERLSAAHDYLKRCFRKVCKPAVWELFQETSR